MSDSEYEEEEILVFADFTNQVLPNELTDANAAMKIIALENEHPLAEINGSIFKGSYDCAMGTNVFFEKNTEDQPIDTLYEKDCKQAYKYFAKTNKIINFESIYVEKCENAQPCALAQKQNNTVPEELKLNITYEEAIQKFPKASGRPIFKDKRS